jgi:choline dehydrogenase-like flavoprotein
VNPEATVDAVVVGSGPGGSTAADVLSAAGWSVVILEKGRNHLIDLDDPRRLLGDFSNDEVKFLCRHFLGPDPLVEPRTFRTSAEDGDRLHVGEVNSTPSTVGGGGVHADGKLPRFRQDDFHVLSDWGPVEGADVDDWPVTYDELEPYYAEAEHLIGVAGEAGANPFASWRSGPYPMPPGPPMYGAVLSAEAAARAGLHPYPAPTGANSVPYGGRPACNNCGHCAYFGCPIHAKGDPVAPLQRALLSGRTRLVPEAFACRVRLSGDRAVGVDYVGPDGELRTQPARHVVLAAGAVETPRLLLLSGIDHPLVGARLMFHFQTFVLGVLPQHLHANRGRSVTHLHDDHIVPDRDSLAAAREAGLPWFKGGVVEHGGGSHPISEARLYPWGPRHKQLMRSSPMRDRLWAFTMQGEDLPQVSNRVDLDPSVKDARGFPVARVTYRPHRHEVVASRYHAARLEAVLSDMGAESTMVATSPALRAQRAFGDLAPAAPISRHVMGTARMGHDPATSVVDPYCRLHGVENLVVADSSVFVTSAGYGPTLTLVALAMRAARALCS